MYKESAVVGDISHRQSKDQCDGVRVQLQFTQHYKFEKQCKTIGRTRGGKTKLSNSQSCIYTTQESNSAANDILKSLEFKKIEFSVASKSFEGKESTIPAGVTLFAELPQMSTGGEMLQSTASLVTDIELSLGPLLGFPLLGDGDAKPIPVLSTNRSSTSGGENSWSVAKNFPMMKPNPDSWDLWSQLLPCGSHAGLASLVTPQLLHMTSWHRMALKLSSQQLPNHDSHSEACQRPQSSSERSLKFNMTQIVEVDFILPTGGCCWEGLLNTRIAARSNYDTSSFDSCKAGLSSKRIEAAGSADAVALLDSLHNIFSQVAEVKAPATFFDGREGGVGSWSAECSGPRGYAGTKVELGGGLEVTTTQAEAEAEAGAAAEAGAGAEAELKSPEDAEVVSTDPSNREKSPETTYHSKSTLSATSSTLTVSAITFEGDSASMGPLPPSTAAAAKNARCLALVVARKLFDSRGMFFEVQTEYTIVDAPGSSNTFCIQSSEDVAVPISAVEVVSSSYDILWHSFSYSYDSFSYSSITNAGKSFGAGENAKVQRSIDAVAGYVLDLPGTMLTGIDCRPVGGVQYSYDKASSKGYSAGSLKDSGESDVEDPDSNGWGYASGVLEPRGCHRSIQWVFPNVTQGGILTTYFTARKRLLNRDMQPVDASRGALVPPSLAFLWPRGALDPHHQLAESFPPPVYTDAFLVVSPIPDLSMPYNVITLFSTAAAFFLGSFINAIIRPTASARKSSKYQA